MTVIRKILAANVVCASFLLPGMTHAQTNNTPHLERQVVASGGTSKLVHPYVDVKDEGLEVDCTVGEIAVRTLTYPDEPMITQGFQQPPLQNLINELEKDEMLVFPNPTTDGITVLYTLDPKVTKVDVRVVSIGGHIVFTETVIPGENRGFEYKMDVTKFNPGIYVITLIMDTGIKVSRKFIKFD